MGLVFETQGKNYTEAEMLKKTAKETEGQHSEDGPARGMQRFYARCLHQSLEEIKKLRADIEKLESNNRVLGSLVKQN